MHFTSVFGAVALASSVLVQNVTYCPSGGVCYAFNVPSATASSGSGDMYFQITGPTSLSWIGLGQGTSMSGANIFMIYSNAAGDNVTLSPRLGTGNHEPQSDTSAKVTLLGGSGLANGMMTANVRCSNCNTWSGGSMSLTDANSNWIWSYKTGTAVNSDDVTINLPQHSNFGTTEVNLQTAAGGSSNNPFQGTGPATVSSSTGAGSSGSSDAPSQTYINARMAHAIMSPVAFVILFPIGAMAIRLLSFPGLVWVHAGWMSLTYIIVLASMGMAVWMAVVSDQIDTYHAIIGLVVVGSLLLQPITGLAHHLLYKKKGGANVATYPHVWWGRAIITLGIINGGFGLHLSDNTVKGEIAYGVVAGVMWLLWMAVIVGAFVRSRGRSKSAGNPNQGNLAEKHDSTERVRASDSGHQQESPKSSTLRPSYSNDGQIAAAPKTNHNEV